MKTRGKKIRFIKNPHTDYFDNLEPLARQRAMDHEKHGDYKYKQSIPRKRGADKIESNYPKNKKF